MGDGGKLATARECVFNEVPRQFVPDGIRFG